MRSLRCTASRGLSFSAMDRRAARCGLYAPNWGCTAASPSAATVHETSLLKHTPERTASFWRRGAKRLASPILRQWRRGFPVIATRCGGPEDFVTEENGILIPVDDESTLTSAMERMMLRREDYDSAAISADIRRKFAPETIAARLTELYEGVLSC